MDHHQYRHALAAHLQAVELAFPDAEFDSRQARVRAVMAEAGLDALLVTDPADIYYLTGYNTFEVSVHTCLVCSADRLVLQVPSIETGPAVVTARVDELLGYRWEGIEEVLEPLAETLSGFSSIGLDSFSPTLRHGIIGPLQQRLGVERFRADGGALLDRIRIVKSEAELACLRESARITSRGLAAAIEVIAPGMTDNDVAAEGARALLAAGSEFMSMQPIVTTGRRISVIHLNHQRHRIERDEPVFLEFGAAFRRYTAPMMRTAVAGRASGEMHAMRDVCRSLFETLSGAMRPGNTFDDAARAAESVLAPHADRVFFSGVFGYAVGAQFPPSWVEGSGYIARGQQREFEADMVFHLPLCLRLPGEWGIGISDTVQVTPAGGVPITDNDWQLKERSGS
ncbi:M24 family metallopeptidase [Billgrantia montanilacus]|uniref:Aminopeptidase P family protein n=1 Tax=Billgrantia montanilacus TaxID=2282305 RepID=A0A368U0T4_9GAMM|nr:Xaa-Pro peptidase family protein [Halomonas montanilacus]RCV90107.1 aminopeptidase P family protein [Halomonas montanilacus]